MPIFSVPIPLSAKGVTPLDLVNRVVGALMDLGCYPATCASSVMGPRAVVLGASCLMNTMSMSRRARNWNSRGSATLTCSMKPQRFGATLKLRGEKGVMEIANYLAPQLAGCRFNRDDRRSGREEPDGGSGGPMLRNWELGDVAAEASRGPSPTRIRSGNMTLIDAIYGAAGVKREFD